MATRIIIGFALCALIGAGALLLARFAVSPTPVGPVYGPNVPAAAPEVTPRPAAEVNPRSQHELYIGRDSGPAARRVHTILTTRKGDAIYQVLIRYEPASVPVTQLPAAGEILQLFARQGKQLPSYVACIEEETEMVAENLGEPLRSVSSYRAYLNPADASVIAYDVAQTTGGQPQRFVGHVSQKGVQVDLYRGGDLLDRREVPFSPGTFILTEMEFIHQWYQMHAETLAKREPVSFSLFIPAYMSSAVLIARPLDDQVIPVHDATYQCARYDVKVGSSQAAEGMGARQEFWFDKRSGLMMKREDIDLISKPSDLPVTERTPVDKLQPALAQIRPLMIQPPHLPIRSFPYKLYEELLYTVRARDAEIGQVRITFSRTAGPPQAPGPCLATAAVNIDTRGSVRHEAAQTWFDGDWQPVAYNAQGEEVAEATALYKINSRLDTGKLEVQLEREVKAAEPDKPADGAVAPVAPSDPHVDGGWHDPLRRVPISDEDAQAQAKTSETPHLARQQIRRALSAGTFLYDFNRVEHLAALAHRLPLPAAGDEKAPPLYQNVALFCVRQNRCGLVQFEIRAEPRPALTKAQQRHPERHDVDEPQLYVATATLALLPCRMLLTAEGRLLELTLKYGSGDVIYTLDDPIMRQRAARASRQKLQEGPQLLRPKWW